jgi:serine/threonine protein kinase
MGEVYKARDTRLERTVAIKVLRAEVAGDSDRVQRFEQEARAASALNHPNIVTIHDIGWDRNTVYIAMEWVEGPTLRELLRRGRLPIARVIEISHQIAEGLAKAHAAGIVHRDLKPENVMVSGDGFVKILDFGLAKLSEPRDASLSQLTTFSQATAPGVVMGTVGYMSPEQASGTMVDHRSDQFALGLIAYEMVTGTRPFERDTAAQTLAATIEAEATPITALNPEVPESLVTVVDRCLAKDPSDRYESTRDLARDLKQIVGSHPVAVSSGRVRETRLKKRWIAVALTAFVVATTVAGWRWWPGRGTRTVPKEPIIAVLPFRSLSPESSQTYFAAGMTEEIGGSSRRSPRCVC